MGLERIWGKELLFHLKWTEIVATPVIKLEYMHPMSEKTSDRTKYFEGASRKSCHNLSTADHYADLF